MLRLRRAGASGRAVVGFALVGLALGACDDGAVVAGAGGGAARDVVDAAWDAADAESDVPDAEAPGPSEGVFTTLTYNVQGLPEAITGSDPAVRMAGIAPLLVDFDLVGLQEDFMEEAHAVVGEGSSHDLLAWFSVVLEERVFGAGLSVLARFAAEDVDAVHYTTCHGRFDHANDCLASKGFQRIRLRLSGHDGAVVDVYNTHMDAGGSLEDGAARAAQVAQVVDSLTTWSAGHAVVLTGDLNLHADEAEDAEILTALIEGGGLTDACAAVECPEPNHIDRVLIRDGDTVDLEVLGWAREEAFVDAEGADLSDHPAISAAIGWSVR